MTIQLPALPKSMKTKSPDRKKLSSVLPEPEGPKNAVDIMHPQRDASIPAGYP